MVNFIKLLKRQKVMKDKDKINVLFVCMGNICRSPTAQGVFQSLVNAEGLDGKFIIDSAGLHNFHVGNSPDLRSQGTARKHGVELSNLSARQFVPADFMNFDFLLAMDESNFTGMQQLQPEHPRGQLSMMLEYSSQYEQIEIPDPYYGDDGFELVFDMVRDACAGLLKNIQKQNNL
ncbi:MAG: protein-tyrosine phosphatase [Gammaproteobacteria bacterium]|jgi:protein-tyrosine phosphatase